MKPPEHRGIALVNDAVSAIRRGGMVVLTDDGDREDEGDLVMAAQKVTPAAVNFMIREARGLVCLSLTTERVRQLQLPLMVAENTSRLETAFTVSIEAATGVTTGISAADRARTIKAAIAPKASPRDLSRPGHVFPLRARDGGVLVRPGHTEGSVDLVRAAGLFPAGVICEVMNDDGTMARQPDLRRFARRHGLPLVSIADLVAWRLAHEQLVRRVGEMMVERPPHGSFRAVAYASDFGAPGVAHLALVKGDIGDGRPVPTRIHRQTLLGDLLDACAGGGDLKAAFERIAAAGRGVILYLQRAPGDEEALALKAPSNVEAVRDHADQTRLREFGIGAQILADLGARRLELLTNTPTRIVGVERYGLSVERQVPLADGGRSARRTR
jgi:3,4-dihydroxy 2-butanone 4-phosphate synthase/GTP cyclohydrolase II